MIWNVYNAIFHEVITTKSLDNSIDDRFLVAFMERISDGLEFNFAIDTSKQSWSRT